MTTPSGQSEIEAYRDEGADPPALVVMAGGTEARYLLRSLTDLHVMLKAHGDWMPLGSVDEQKTAAEGTVEAWAPDRLRTLWAAGRAEKGPPGTLRELRATGDGGAGTG